MLLFFLHFLLVLIDLIDIIDFISFLQAQLLCLVNLTAFILGQPIKEESTHQICSIVNTIDWLKTFNHTDIRNLLRL